MGKIRSKLVTFTVTAKEPNSDNFVQWEIKLQGNRIREDREDWLKGAREYYRDIKLTRKSTAQTARVNRIKTKAEIAAEGLKILDQLIAARTGQTA